MGIALTASLDLMTARTVPAEETRSVGGWIVRRSAGLPLKRTNSVFPRDHAARGVIEDIAACERYYAERDLPTRFQISPASRPSGLAELLIARGYEPHSTTSTYTCDLTALTSPALPPEMAAQLTRSPTEQWWSTWATTNEPGDRAATDAMFERIPEKLTFVHVTLAGRGAGIGMSVLHGDWFGIFFIATSPRFRQRGVGRIVVDALMRSARTDRARFGYVQVEARNDPALALYARAGYRCHVYDYRYLSMGASV
jgi:GNAT superfamily N-acetyltransferase